jgi:hypothetical protein
VKPLVVVEPYQTGRSAGRSVIASWVLHRRQCDYSHDWPAAVQCPSAGLASDEPWSFDPYRLGGIYTGVQLIINLRTANMLDLTFPLSLLGRADKVIELESNRRCNCTAFVECTRMEFWTIVSRPQPIPGAFSALSNTGFPPYDTL